MKKISWLLVLFGMLSHAQSGPFDTLWKQVETYESKGLPRSAIEVVNTIYDKAKEANDAGQLIKAFLYRSKYTLQTEENAEWEVIRDLKSEIAHSEPPVRNILENVLANLYWQYFRAHSTRYYDRTQMSVKDTADFRTWSLPDLFGEISTHFRHSLEHALILQNISLERYSVLLETNRKTPEFYPALYDFLVQDALNFFKSEEGGLLQPEVQFELDNPALLGDNETFLEADLTSVDSLSQKRQALLLYKELTRFHKQKNHLPALLNVTLQRMDFVHSHAVFPGKDEVYLNALQQLKKQHTGEAYATVIDFRLAQEYVRRAKLHTLGEKDAHSEDYVKAASYCHEAIRAFPGSDGAGMCRNLLAQIEQRTIHLQSEQFVLPGNKRRMYVRYRNIDKLYIEIFKSSHDFKERLRHEYSFENKIKKISKRPLVTSFEAELPLPADYHEHSTEVILPALPAGEYIVLARSIPDGGKKPVQAFGFVQSTSIALTEIRRKSYVELYVAGRDTGEPLSGARVHLYNIPGRYATKIDKQLVTGSDGKVEFAANDKYFNIYVEVTYDGEKTLFGPINYYNYYDNRNNKYREDRVYIFTDRSIYRPGQTVYFKGIAVHREEDASEVIADAGLEVSLLDVNNQEVAKWTGTTNEYGSVSGTFVLPEGGLTGRYTLKVERAGIRKKGYRFNAYHSIMVEEYKRPRFTVSFDTIRRVYKVGDTIRIQGKAESYAGSNISGAGVKYEVVRKVNLPRWIYYFRPYFTPGESRIIARGKLVSADDGTFEIQFPALPDRKISPDDLPVFNYEIKVEVTDINGETRTGITNVRAGYHSIVLDMTFPGRIGPDMKKTGFELKVRNLNGAPAPASGEIAVYKLKNPDRVLRPAPWQAPEFLPLDREEFIRNFPHDPYGDELNETKWEKEQTLWQQTFDTQGDYSGTLKGLQSWKPGRYLIEVRATDPSGKEVVEKRFFTVAGRKAHEFSLPEILTLQVKKDTYKPGDIAQITVGSAAKDAYVSVWVLHNDNRVEKYNLRLNGEKKTLAIPLSEKDYGGVRIKAFTVKYNSFVQRELVLNVPYPETELQIETEVFRDKIRPGEEEKWSFLIKGPKGDKVAAEVLASMYDMSLDQFLPHRWSFDPIYYKPFRNNVRISGSMSFAGESFRQYIPPLPSPFHPEQPLMRFRWYGFGFYKWGLYGYTDGGPGMVRALGVRKSMRMEKQPVPVEAEVLEEVEVIEDLAEDTNAEAGHPQQEEGESGAQAGSAGQVAVRTHLQETAFFFPQLRTDEQGYVHLEFTSPEALTRWKLMLLAHTPQLNTALGTYETVTQKELMLMPNPPRFLREGDRIVFQTKIVNLSKQNIAGNVLLELKEGVTGERITRKILNGKNKDQQSFDIPAGGNTVVEWEWTIPGDVQVVQYTVKAQAGAFSDGERNLLPVLTNRMLVTESMPMWVGSGQTKTFRMKKLASYKPATLKNHLLTLEVTSNPAWYAVQALPYLMEYPHECSEQTFARLYANTLASYVVHSNPRIEEVFDQWKSSGALISQLEKNPRLKTILISETPWLRDARSESEQKKRIALLFDLNKLSRERNAALRKLQNMQLSGGGFPWFKGSNYPNRYITQHIVSGFGHLRKLTGEDLINENRRMIDRAISFLDEEIVRDYKRILENANRFLSMEVNNDGEKRKNDYLKNYKTGAFQIHYLYTRSFFPGAGMNKALREAMDFFKEHAYSHRHEYPLHTKALLVLIAGREGRKDIVGELIASMKETAVYNDELGMYWKGNTAGYGWYQAPIETQALVIEAFSEVTQDTASIDKMKIWLLKNKQTNRWNTTKATTEAVYALLLQGTDWLGDTSEFVEINIGGNTLEPMKLQDTKVEAGTGYFKTSWHPGEITPEMAEVTLHKRDKGIAWGALYWQYFEDLDKITPGKTPLSLKKNLYKVTKGHRGEQLVPLDRAGGLKVGDLVRVRIELRSDRDMQFIHMKDMRASGLEPVDVLSRYRWQDGLGYYQSTKDAATHFFFDRLPKGVYVFEYDLRVNNSGDFSNGITLIESMYAPEFRSHSQGERIQVE